MFEIDQCRFLNQPFFSPFPFPFFFFYTWIVQRCLFNCCFIVSSAVINPTPPVWAFLALAYRIYFTKPIKTNKHTITKHVAEKYAYQKRQNCHIVLNVCQALHPDHVVRDYNKTVLWRRRVLSQLGLLTNWTNIITEFRENEHCLHSSC